MKDSWGGHGQWGVCPTEPWQMPPAAQIRRGPRRAGAIRPLAPSWLPLISWGEETHRGERDGRSLDPVGAGRPSAAPVVRQCAACERCRDCDYTHVGVACPDPAPGFDGTCLCDPELKTVA